MALLTVVSLLTPLAAARGAAACGSTTGAWKTIAGPRFPQGPQRITDLAVEARAPSRMYATNGAAIVRSSDGGCSWQDSYLLGEEEGATYTPATARITSVVAPESGGRALATVTETIVNQSRPHVLVSFDAGRSWEAGTGLPPLGSPEALVVAPSSPDIAYLGIDLGGGIPIDSFWASTDGGRTWEARDQHPGGEFTGFEVDPINATELWAYGNGLHKSTDGGTTWTPIAEFVGTGTGPIDIFHSKGPSSLFVFIPSERIVQQSADGGETWVQSYGLSAPDSVDHGATSQSRVATSAGNVYVWAPSLLQWVDVKAPANGITDVAASRAPSPEFFMHNGSSILIYGGDTGDNYNVDTRDFDMGDISISDTSTAYDLDPPKLAPNKDIVKIPAGEEKRVRYDLSLSKIRTPLDLYFLVDTSESAKPFLTELGQTLGSIVTELYSAGLDVRFGLSEFRAYPDSEPPRPECSNENLPLVEDGQCERNFVYRQVLDIPEANAASLETAIEGLVPIAGGHYNSQLDALQQVADGSGVDVWPEGTTSSHLDGHDVPQGQDASFRKGALKVVLISTDEEYSTGQPYPNDRFPPEIPSFEEVAASLNSRDDGIHQIGLALAPHAIADMRRMAALTGALAPSRGADCDGNGSADIAPGAPLVCQLQRTGGEGSNLAPAIVNLVEAIRDKQTVSLEVGTREPVVDEITPEEYPGVALQTDQDLKFDVTYRCPMTLAGEKVEVDLTANQGGSTIADATATVVCGKKPPKDFFSSLPFDRVIALALLPLTPPPTLANPGTQAQAQSQAQAQGAMAAQEQEQPQLAMVTQYKSALKESLAKEDEFLMTRYRSRTAPAVPPGLFVGGAGLLMGLAYGLATSRRRRVAPAHARRS